MKKGLRLKLTFTPPSDGRVHSYCLYCGQESPRSGLREKRLAYECKACGRRHTRALIIDPGVRWWCDETGEYWHETAGIFLSNNQGEFLFFERTRHPFGLTVPAGHVDTGELEMTTARRELGEEAGVLLPNSAFRHVVSEAIYGDECRRGADVHRWHIFTAKLPSHLSIIVDEREGVNPIWLRLEDALERKLTFATRYIISRHCEAIAQIVG
ncbi:MAG TPA: NUDIX domain-containing protein [Candidatus Saccharimonadales bacterium]|nr:NUDIX domain-containing protein [Candidatus Saccharimonadales bacterium]